MKLVVVIAGISCVVVSSAFVSAQDQALAEQQFKNIQSFKGEKASEVIPAMEFMGESLKVSCDFCHVADRSSDEKQEKKTARDMIAMQKDINAKNFGGRNVVTCATCHAGHTRPINLPPIPGVETRPRRSSDVAPDQVLAAYAKALGADAAHPVAGIHLTGTTTARGTKSPVDAYYAGAKIAFVIHGTPDQKQGFNGTAVWFTTPGGTQTIPMSFGEQFVKQDALYTSSASLPVLDTPSGGTAKIDDKDVVVVSGTITGEKVRASLFFDKASGLLVRTAFYYPTILGSIAQINDYSNYKDVGGVQIPMTIATHSPQGDTLQEYATATIDANIDPALFEPAK